MLASQSSPFGEFVLAARRVQIPSYLEVLGLQLALFGCSLGRRDRQVVEECPELYEKLAGDSLGHVEFAGRTHKVVDGRGAEGVYQASRDLDKEYSHQNRGHPGRWVRTEAGGGER